MEKDIRSLPRNIITRRKIDYNYDNWTGLKYKSKCCRFCDKEFSPQAPSHLYCSNECAALGIAENRYQKLYKIGVRDVEKLLDRQNYLCAICKEEGFKMNEGVYNTLNVDHCHSTNQVRGLLCHNCNRGLGLFKDDISRLETAISYLKGATTISKESTPKPVEAHDSES